MILLVDNYDSFVHNLARYARELGHPTVVCRNDRLGLADIERLGPTHIILSPGPCSPAEAGISTAIVGRFGPRIPILGVCLGHQCIGGAYGAAVVRARRPIHGRTSSIVHDGTGIFSGLPPRFRVARYHSLVIDEASVPAELAITARAVDDDAIMAVAHRRHRVWGVQFHPESVATEYGYAMLDRFLHDADSKPEDLPAEADRLGSTPPARIGFEAGLQR